MTRFSAEGFIQRSGGLYIIATVVASQLIGLVGVIPGILFLRLDLELTGQAAEWIPRWLPFLLIASNVILLIWVWQNTSTARIRLDEWRSQTLKPHPQVELTAWKEITNLPTAYGLASLVVYTILGILPPFLMTLLQGDVISSVFQPGTITSPVPAYILLGGLAAMIGMVVFSLLIIERFTLIPRLILLPNDFENQLTGRSGALLGIKFQLLVLGLMIVGIGVIAPLGYQQAIRILYEEVSSIQVFEDLRTWSIMLSLVALGLGLLLTYMASRTITSPLRQLIETFQQVERGELSQRIPVTATDELATVAIHFNRMVSQLESLQTTLEDQVNTRTKQLKATNEVGRVASSILDPEELLGRIATLIAEQFGYYYAAIYLVDPTEKWAELKEATGQTGYVLKQNRHRLDIGGRSMVATCIREKSPRIAQSAAQEKQRFENPLLPYTRSEIALPLIVGERVLGALDVQSTKENDFDLGVIETMQNLAGQIAISLENARLYQEAQRSIQELRAIQKQYLLEGWTNVASLGEELEYGVGETSDVATRAIQTPINLREQVFGEIMIEGNEEWTPEQRSLVDAIAAQAAIALENARLVSETRQVAMRERALAEINSKIWSSPSIDSILQTVIKELGRRLDAVNATIELKMDDNQS